MWGDKGWRGSNRESVVNVASQKAEKQNQASVFIYVGIFMKSIVGKTYIA